MYYLIRTNDNRCYGTADNEPNKMDGYIYFKSDELLDNPHDYILKDGVLVYNPIQKEGETT